MKFTIAATIATLALANLGFAAPAEELEQRTPSPAQDSTVEHGWDGKTTPYEKVGTVVPVSAHDGPEEKIMFC